MASLFLGIFDIINKKYNLDKEKKTDCKEEFKEEGRLFFGVCKKLDVTANAEVSILLVVNDAAAPMLRSQRGRCC